MPIYSHSRISTYENCPRQYKFRYIEKIREEGFESVEAFLGSRVHETLEHLYNCVGSGQLLTEDETLKFYETAWNSNWSEDVQIVEKGRLAEHYWKVGRQCVLDYYRHYQPFNQGRVLESEKRLSIKLDPRGRYQMMGYVDRIDKVAEGIFEIHDYKTNRSLPSQEQKDQDRQLALYEIGLRDFLGGNVKKVGLVWHFLRFDHEIRSFRTKKELDDLRQAMISRIQEIEAAAAEDRFPTHKSRLCDWCEYQPLCPLWKHRYTVEEKAAQPKPLPDDGATLIDQFTKLDRQRTKLLEQVRPLEEQMGAIKEAILRYAKKRKLECVFGAERQATVTHKVEWSIPTKSGDPEEYEEMVALLRKTSLWPELTDFSGAKLKALLDTPEGRRLQTKLAKLIEREEKWRVSVRKKQEEE